MRCSHVLGLIDAGPFADYPRAHLEAAWSHARECETCGPALRAATALTSGLAALPQIAAPRHLEGAVLARIAFVDQTYAAPTSLRADSVKRDWSTWATVLGGFAAALAFAMSISSGDALPSDMTSTLTTMRPLPPTTNGALAMAAGLVLYIAGLFVPIAGRRGPRE